MDNNIQDIDNLPEEGSGHQEQHNLQGVNDLYEDWFLEYASYVILERAVPAIEDGLKPVQRRILHAMKEMDDGRFNKVANVIGSTMQYHPHGDAAIGEALVNLGQKELLFDCQGNWGDIRTGDSAAAARYIEARLSKFALEVAFNAQTTHWQQSYDGRKREPINLPMKFPLLLAQGVEGIAVGLATKIMPHNFVELCNASILHLQKKPFELYPDFLTGAMVDVTNYKEGKRGGKIRVRAKIEEKDKKTLLITEIPFSTTTGSITESIVKANDQGKIKVKKVTDITAKNTEIEIQLIPGTSIDVMIDALYAFTQCEVSISPNACIIIADKPHFISVIDILKISTDNTVQLLKRELEIRLNELEEKWHFSSLEKIFIENRIYRDIEECETWEAVISTIDKGLDPYKKLLRREVTREDIVALTEIKIKRISKFDGFKADELMRSLEEEMEEVKNNLLHLTNYAIAYFKNLLKKYGAGKERKTEIKLFDNINTTAVAIANQKLYVNRKEGFVGFGNALKKDEFIADCSDMDDIITFRNDGKFSIIRAAEKVFVGKDIIHCAIWKKNDERMVYNAIYTDGNSGVTRAKRFAVTAITRNTDYDFTMGSPKSKIWHLSANPNGEAEVMSITLSPGAKARTKVFDFDFADMEIKGRGSQGNILTKYPIRLLKIKSKGRSTLGGQKIWFDTTYGRLNTDEKGTYLGSFNTDESITVFYNDGQYEMTGFELTNRYDPDKIALITKTRPNNVYSAVYFHGAQKTYYAKRFSLDTLTLNKKFFIIPEEKGSLLTFVTDHNNPMMKVHFGKKTKSMDIYPFFEFTEVRNSKAIGTKIPQLDITSVELMTPKETAGEPIEDSDGGLF